MDTRICPGCSTPLGNYDSYFCSVCGEHLPAELIPLSKPKHTEVLAAKPALGLFGKHVFAKVGVAVFLCVLGFFGYKAFLLPGLSLFINSLSSKESPLPQQPGASITFGVSPNPGVFGSHEILTYVPADIDLYFESFALHSFLSETSGFDPKLAGLAQGLFEEHFAVFARADAWTVILVPKDTKVLSEILKDAQPGYWFYRVYDNKLIITNNEFVFADVEAAKKETVKNVKQTPSFARASAKLPNEGNGMLVFITPQGKKLLEDLKTGSDNARLKAALSTLSEKGYDEAIIVAEK